MTEERNPWERIPEERTKPWMAFCIFRDIGPKRSLDEAWRRYLGKTTYSKGGTVRASGTIQAWAKKFRWIDRAKAWDAHCDQVAREAHLQEIRDMGKRQATLGRAFQAKGAEKLKILEAKELDAAEALRYSVEGAKLERLAVGAPTEEVRQTTTNINITPESLSDADLEALARAQLARHQAAIGSGGSGDVGASPPEDGEAKLP